MSFLRSLAASLTGLLSTRARVVLLDALIGTEKAGCLTLLRHMDQDFSSKGGISALILDTTCQSSLTFAQSVADIPAFILVPLAA